MIEWIIYSERILNATKQGSFTNSQVIGKSTYCYIEVIYCPAERHGFSVELFGKGDASRKGGDLNEGENEEPAHYYMAGPYGASRSRCTVP